MWFGEAGVPVDIIPFAGIVVRLRCIESNLEKTHELDRSAHRLAECLMFIVAKSEI